MRGDSVRVHLPDVGKTVGLLSEKAVFPGGFGRLRDSVMKESGCWCVPRAASDCRRQPRPSVYARFDNAGHAVGPGVVDVVPEGEVPIGDQREVGQFAGRCCRVVLATRICQFSRSCRRRSAGIGSPRIAG